MIAPMPRIDRDLHAPRTARQRAASAALARVAILTTALALSLSPLGGLQAVAAAATPRASIASGPATASSRPPNIVLIVADDLGFSDLGSYGAEFATPHLDALAMRGARFTNFHVAASCSPTRAMLLTGVDNHLAGVGNMRETIPREHLGKPGYLSVLNERVVTVSTLLQDAGYRTYAAGKWHVGKEPHNLPDRRGFDHSLVQGDSGSDNWYTAQRYLDLADKVYWFEDGKPATMPERYYSSAYFVDKLLGWLRADQTSPVSLTAQGPSAAATRRDRPFFLYLPFQANHLPVQAPREFVDKYRGAYDSGWTAMRQARRDRAAALGVIPKDATLANARGTPDWSRLTPEERQLRARHMEVYAGMAEAMDFHIGRLVNYLKEIGEYERTVFVFLSDNGAEGSDPYAVLSGRLWLKWQYRGDTANLGGPDTYGAIGPHWAGTAAAPLAGYKFYATEGGIRVPLVIAGVPGMQGGRIHHAFAHATDITPTLLELAQVPHPGRQYRGQPIEPLAGTSLLPVLRGHSERVRTPEQPVGYELSGNAALFKGDYKLVRNLPPMGDNRWQLFDIVRDPGETRDLSTQMPDLFTAMQADYQAYAHSHGVLPMPAGYDPVRQVEINALLNVYVPRFQWPALGLLALLLAGGWFWWKRRR